MPNPLSLLLAHVAGEESKEVAFKKYLPVTLNGVGCRGLVDSGNLWRTAISEGFFRQLGLSDRDLRPVAVDSIATAKEGARLDVLGETRRNLHLRMAGLPTKFKFRPVVVAGLNMPLNISGPFLRRHQIDQVHSQDALRVQGRLVPLLEHRHDPQERAQASLAYVAEEVVIPALSAMFLPVRVPAVEAGQMQPGEGLLGADGGHLEEKGGVHPCLSALVNVGADGLTYTSVMNSSDEPLRVPAGLRVGTFERGNDQANHDGDGALFHLAEPGPEDETLLATVRATDTRDLQLRDPEQEATQTPQTKEWSRAQKVDWLRREFKIDDSPCLTEEQKSRALALLLQFFDIFAADGSFGCTDLLEHEIHTDDVAPIKTRWRPINPLLEKDLRAQLDKWLAEEVIEPSNSPWSFAMVAAPKKNGKIRWCVDYRQLNAVTRKDSFPLPQIEDNLARLAHSTVFSGIDGSGAFHVVKVRKQDRAKTAFSTPFGLFQFQRMPFGLTNGPATYSRLVQLVLNGIPPSMALPYLDDTIIHSRNVDDHLKALARVLQAHRKAGLKLQPSKCQLFQPKVEYLGHEVSKDGVRPVPEYVQVVKQWPLPKTRTEARCFLGKIGYYRRFIKDYSALAAPWTDVTGKVDKEEEKKPLEITTAMTAAFEKLKSALLQAPVLAYPRFDDEHPFLLDTDWSLDANAIGGVLSQVQEGQERVICYGGKKMSKSQRNYSSVKGEAAAIFHFITTWRYYLQYRHFVVRCDNRALAWMKTMEPQDRMVARWLATLANFDFEVVHRPGEQHANADAISRAPHVAAHAEAEEEVGTDAGLHAVGTPAEGDSLFDLVRHPLWSSADLCQMQREDEDLGQILRWMDAGERPDAFSTRCLGPNGQVYAGLFDSLFRDEKGVLRYRYPAVGPIPGKVPVCLPRELWDQAIARAHEEGAHMAAESTTQRLRGKVFFPHMRREVAGYIDTCLPCQAKKRRSADQKHTLVSPLEGYPFQRLAMDYVGPLRPSRQGHHYILTVRCTFTKWLEAFPMRQATAKETIRILERQVFCRFGVPDSIHSDRGSQFTSGLFRDMGKALGIRLTTTPAYNPKSNPVERAHRDLGNALRALVGENYGSWEDILPQAVFALNTHVSAATGLAPYQLMFGREPSTPLDLLFGSPPTKEADNPCDHHTYLRQLKQRAQAAQAYARNNLAQAVRRQRRSYHAEAKSFLPGQRVWLFTPNKDRGETRKLVCCWTGPWTIVARLNELMYRIAPDPTWRPRPNVQAVSVDRLKLYKPPRGESRPPADEDDLPMDGDEFAVNLPDQGEDEPMEEGSDDESTVQDSQDGDGDDSDDSDDDDDDQPGDERTPQAHQGGARPRDQGPARLYPELPEGGMQTPPADLRRQAPTSSERRRRGGEARYDLRPSPQQTPPSAARPRRTPANPTPTEGPRGGEARYQLRPSPKRSEKGRTLQHYMEAGREAGQKALERIKALQWRGEAESESEEETSEEEVFYTPRDKGRKKKSKH